MRALHPTLHTVASLAIAITLVPPTSGIADHDAILDPAPRATQSKLKSLPGLDRSAITASGISSGGFFAHQFHVAYSTLVNGAGIVAGGPFGCVEKIPNPYWPWVSLDRVSAAVVACTHYFGDRFYGLRPSDPKASDSLAFVRKAHREDAIDDPANLADDRVYVFLGGRDGVVPEVVVRALHTLYGSLGVRQLRLDAEARANHGMPVATFPQESRFPKRTCGEHDAPFVIECGYDAAERIFRQLYGDGFQATPKDAHDSGTIMAFDQTEFFNAAQPRTSLSGVGYAFVPNQCRTGSCRLHVAFHGCKQNVDAQGDDRAHDDFIRDASYNRWAAANDIVVLYPQVTASTSNPNRCWDFWGYSDLDYYARNGRQMRAVKAMVDRLLGTLK